MKIRKIFGFIFLIMLLSSKLSFAAQEIDLSNEEGINQLRDLILLASEDYNQVLQFDIKDLNFKMEDIVKYISKYTFVSDKEIEGLQFTIKNNKEIDVRIIFEMSELESWIVNEYVKDVIEQYTNIFQTDEQKIEILHDYVTYLLEYDDSLECSSSYCAITEKRAICRGYNKLLYKLLKAVGVKANIVAGFTQDEKGNKTPHEWLELKTKDGYRYIDSTWNDSSKSKDYYMKTKEEMSKDHIIEYIIRR